MKAALHSNFDSNLLAILAELNAFGKENDTRAKTRSERMLNITPDTGVFLAIQVQATRSHRILEIGTSNGYSTLWLAEAARRIDGKVTTLEILPAKAALAKLNVERANLARWVDMRLGEAGEFLRNCKASQFDFVFLDADREQYVEWWPTLQEVLVPGGLIVVDNATSHASEIASFLTTVQKTSGYTTSLVPLGNGELLILKPQ